MARLGACGGVRAAIVAALSAAILTFGASTAQAMIREKAPDGALAAIASLSAERLVAFDGVQPFAYQSARFGALELQPSAFYRQAQLFGVPLWTYDVRWTLGDVERGLYATFDLSELQAYASAQNVVLPERPSLSAWELYGGKAVLIAILTLALFARRMRQAVGQAVWRRERSDSELPDLTALFAAVRKTQPIDVEGARPALPPVEARLAIEGPIAPRPPQPDPTPQREADPALVFERTRMIGALPPERPLPKPRFLTRAPLARTDALGRDLAASLDAASDEVDESFEFHRAQEWVAMMPRREEPPASRDALPPFIRRARSTTGPRRIAATHARVRAVSTSLTQ